MAVMKLGKDPPDLQVLMALFLQLLLVNSSQAIMNEVPTMKMEPIPISDLKYGESNKHKANNRPQRWVQQSDYQSMQPHFQEQYMQTHYMEQPYQADISHQDHAINAPISVYPNPDLTYQNQYIDYSGYSPNNNAQNEVQSNQFVEYSNPNLNTYAGNVQENDNLFQYQNERQQENQPYYNEEQQRDSLLLFTGYDDYDLTNTEWEIVNEHTLDTQQGNANDQSQEQSMRTNTDDHTNSFQQLNQDNNIDQGDLTADNDKTDIYLDSIRNPKMIWEEPLQHSHEAKIDNIQSLQQQLLETQIHLMQLYQDLKHDKMIDHPEQDSSSIKYKYENKGKDIVEPEIYYDQNSAMANQLGLTDNIIENEYESGVIYKYENDDSEIKMDNMIFPYKERQFNEPKYTYKHPKKVEKDLELSYKIPKEKDIILDLKYKFPKSTKDQIDTVTIDSKLPKNPRSQGNGNDHLYRYKKGRSMDFGNLEEKQPEYNLEDSNSNKIEKAHSVDNDNIPLNLFGSIRGSPESEENGLMEANIVETKNKDISMDDIPKTKMSDKKAKVRKIDRFEKCDPWDPNTKTESVTSDTNIGEGTLKRTISKRYCDNNSVDNNSGQNTPCFKTITTETTVLNEYCLLPEYQGKNEGMEPCFKNTTTTLSVTRVPCDKTEDNLLENENLTAKNESSFVTTPPNIEVIPSIKLNNSSVIKNLLYNNKTTAAPLSVTTGPLDNNLFQNDNLTTLNIYPLVTIPPKAEITPTMDNNLFENDNLTTINTYPSVTIPPKAEITPAMDMNGSLTENKLSDTIIDNNSDCMDYRQYNKDFTNSNDCIIKSSGVSEEDINIILELHNLLRSKVARGEEKRGGPGPQAPAANMKELRWNNDLARAAQAWAQQCPQENSPPKYRKICSRNYEIGQNVAYFGVKIDDKVQQNEKHNGEGLNKVRKKRSIDQSNSFEDSLRDEDISDAIIDDDNDLEDSIIDDDNYLEDAIIDDDKYLEDSIIDDDNDLEDSIIDDNNYLEDSMINDDKFLEDSIIDDEKSFEDSIIDDDKSLEDSIADDDNYLEASMINDDKYLEDSLIDDDKSLEDSIIDKDKSLEDSIIYNDKSLEDSIIDDDKSLEDSIIDDDNYLENSLIDDDKYLEDSIIDDDKHLEVTIIADDKYLEDSIIDDDKYIEDSIIDDNKYLEDSMIDDNKYLEDSIIDDDKYIEDSKIDDDKYLEDSIIDDDKYLEDSIIDDDKYLEDSIIDDDLYIEHEIIGKDTYIEDSIIDDDMYLEDKIIDKDTDKEDSIIDDDIYLEEEIIGKDTDKDNSIIDDDMHSDEEIIEDDKSVEDTLIDDISNDDEAFVMDDTNDDEAVIALKSSEDQFIESDNIDDHLISNVIEQSEEIVMDKGESNMDLPISDGHIEKYMEKDTIPKLHSYETELENMNIFNSLDKAQDKRKGWKNVIMDWYKGVDVFPTYMVNSITNLKNNEEGMDAYLQVVWAETEEIGCSVVHFSDNRQNGQGGSEDYYYQEEELSSIYVCNYGPAASRDKASVYTVGDAGTQCLDGVSPDYHDLCRSNSSFT